MVGDTSRPRYFRGPTEPGDRLVQPVDLAAQERRASFIESHTGMRVDRGGGRRGASPLYLSPVVSLPLPQAGRGWDALQRTGRRVASTLCSPLYWLPAELFIGGDPERCRDEDALRAALAILRSDLYDPVDGVWLDVLAPLGIDVRQPDGLARVARWDAGGRDLALDGLDLRAHFDAIPWAAQSAAALLPPMIAASWSLTARDLGGRVSAMLRDVEAHSTEYLVSACEAIVSIGHERLALCRRGGLDRHEFWRSCTRLLVEMGDGRPSRSLVGGLLLSLEAELDEVEQTYAHAIVDLYGEIPA
ncbi:hypothetical protein [Demequina pelophila]|uniref:hypothetical protein n=1 Tax=Demequina pelophila TaxID=1638984 RepID=UPI0007807D43|nr:hypothetical protein [Demequina pelophila]